MADLHGVGGGVNADNSHLRERPSVKPLHLHRPDDAKERVLKLNSQEEAENKSEGDRRTYGRTKDGTGE